MLTHGNRGQQGDVACRLYLYTLAGRTHVTNYRMIIVCRRKIVANKGSLLQKRPHMHTSKPAIYSCLHHELLSRLCNHALILPRLDIFQRSQKVLLWILQSCCVWLLACLQIRMDELDQAIEVFCRNLNHDCQHGVCM